MSDVLRTALLALLPQDHPSHSSTAAVTRRPDTYAPGPIREASDRERSAVIKFTEAHPEYAKLSQDEIVQAMSTYRTDEQRAERKRLDDAGVPSDWPPLQGMDLSDEMFGRFG